MSDLTYKVLNTDGTITVYDKAAEIDSQLADISNFLDTPIATYIYSGNPEIVVSAVDVDTNTFTSVGHGLADNDVVAFTINEGAAYSGNYRVIFPTGIGTGSYYVVNKTGDTFQLSATSGGAAVDVTTNASLDLTKIHIEKQTASSIAITSLPDAYRYLVRVYVKAAYNASALQIRPSTFAHAQQWLNTASATIAYSDAHSFIPTHGFIEAIFDSKTIYQRMAFSGMAWWFQDTTNTGQANISLKKQNAKNVAVAYINDITIVSTSTLFFPLNGMKVEVYKA